MGEFGRRLAEAVSRRGPLCPGIDPHKELLRAWGLSTDSVGLAKFCDVCVAAFADFAVVKPQVAFFEAYGAAGWAALERVRARIPADVPVIADAKRGDIGSTSRAYAAAYVEPRGDEPPLADAITVNPYLGRDSLEPFLRACRRHGAGLFCLVKTSNEGGADVQDLVLTDGHPVWHHVALLVHELGEGLVGEHGLSAVGAVVGATHPRAVAEARRLLPQAILLLPGVGAQGATPADLARAFTSGPASALVNASRSVIYAFRNGQEDWRGAASAEAARLRREVWAVSGW